MPQRTEYEALPGTRHDQYVLKIRQILDGLAQPGGTDFKKFRSSLRELGLWDKDKVEAMLSLIDLRWDRNEVQVGPLARKLHEAGRDPQEVQRLLFERLQEQNVLLVKYVAEALDVEAGGRLHSVHELYRMVTSYVYPGEHVRLPCFQAWMDWLAGSGFIRMVGIRWALSDMGLKLLPELRGMDVEEILEDLEEEAAGGALVHDEAAWGGLGDEAAAPSAVAASAPPGDEDDDLFADLPPEPEPPSEAAVAAAQQAFTDRFEDVPGEAPQAAHPAAGAGAGLGMMLHQPLGLGATLPMPGLLGDPAAVEELVEPIVRAWRQWATWPRFTAEALGVRRESPGDLLLLELGCVAVLIEGLEPQPQVFAFVERLRTASFFDNLAADGYGAAVEALGDLDREPWLRALATRLVHTAGVARRLSAEPGALERVRRAADGADAVALLRAELFGGAGREAPFWVLRELLRFGAVDDGPVRSASVVPTARLLHNAWRIGLVARPEVVSFEGLVAVSAAAAQLFGADGEALEVMDRALGLGAGRI